MIGSRRRHKESGLPNDVEMMQTDIMRFLAIICMCLMILFALVQTMPLTGDKAGPSLQSPAIYERHIQALRSTLNDYKAELKKLSQEKEQRRQYLETLEENAEKRKKDNEQLIEKATDTKQKVQQAEKRLAELKIMLDQSEQSINKADNLLSEKQQALTKVEDSLKNTGSSFMQRKQDMALVEENLNKAQSKLEQAKLSLQKAQVDLKPVKPEQDLAQKPAEQAETKAPIKQSKQSTTQPPVKKESVQIPARQESMPPAETKQKGFSLTFAGEEALRSLIAENKLISMFLIAGGNSWKLQAGSAKNWKFIKGTVPASLYEMEIDSVPYMIRRAGKKVVSISKRADLFYGVLLAPSIDNAIRQLMENRSGGDLVIEADGSVGIQ